MKLLSIVLLLIVQMPVNVFGQSTKEIRLDFGRFENDNFIVDLILKNDRADTLDAVHSEDIPFLLLSIISPKDYSRKKSYFKNAFFTNPKIIDYSISTDSVRVQVSYVNKFNETSTQVIDYTASSISLKKTGTDFQIRCVKDYKVTCYREDFHDNGNLRRRVEISSDGKANGKYLIYDDEGNLRVKRYYLDNVLEGNVTYYYKNGKKEFKIENRKGERVKRTLYDSKGKKREGVHIVKRTDILL